MDTGMDTDGPQPELGEGRAQLVEIRRALKSFDFEQTEGESTCYQVTKLLGEWARRKLERDEFKEQILLRQQQDAKIAEEVADEYLGSGRGRLADSEAECESLTEEVGRLEKRWEERELVMKSNKDLEDENESLTDDIKRLKDHLSEREIGWKRTKEIEDENFRLRRRAHVLLSMIDGVLDADGWDAGR